MSIICGTDLSEASGGALDVARALAGQRDDRDVVLVHVVDPDAGDGEPSDAERAELRARLEAQADARRATPGPAIRTELLTGPIEKTLVGVAEDQASDLLIIAAHSRAEHQVLGLARLGSTAAKVIALTHVPVIVVRDPAPW